MRRATAAAVGTVLLFALAGCVTRPESPRYTYAFGVARIAVVDPQLAGSTWQIVSARLGHHPPIVADRKARDRLDFDTAGHVAVIDSDRRERVPVSTYDGQVAFGQPAHARDELLLQSVPDAHISALLGRLEIGHTPRYRITGDTLVLTENGATATFRRTR